MKNQKLFAKQNMPYLLTQILKKKVKSPKAGISYFLLFTFYFLLFCPSGLAQQQPDSPKINPLEIKTPDPLLPQIPTDRPLDPAERLKLSIALDQLSVEAAQQLKAGNRLAAWEIWYRELRLRRVLGPLEEVAALGRVGGIAWNENQSSDVQLITRRLQTIQQEAEAKPPMDLELLKALGQAYQQVRSPELAINVYEQILVIAHQQDRVTEEATLKTLAELHISWFDYPKAALRYEELLVFAKAEGDRYNQVAYLQQLAYIYDKLIQPERALTAKQQLTELYLKKPDLALLIPALKIAIAADYEAMKLADDASQNYQEAYRLALASQQFAYASEALQKLAALYESFDQFDYALQVYQVLLQVDQQSYDSYGMMNAYDKIGQIHLKQKNYPQALTAFKQGLELAKSLKYQENYFTTQIEQATQQSSQ